MATVEPKTHGLTAEEREKYAKDGFFIRPNAFGADEIDALRDRVEDLVELIETSEVLTEKQKQVILKRNVRTDVTFGPASLSSIWRLHMFSAWVRSHIRDPRRLNAVTEIVGPDLFCPNDLYFFKPPGTGRPIAWHQDSWYFRNTYISSIGDAIQQATIGTWLALDDADEDNGCLWVIPGSHLLGVVDHSQVESDDYLLQKRVTVSDEMEERAEPVEVPKGALVFFNNALLHRSTPNRSHRFRRAYIAHYMKATIRHIKNKQWAPEGTQHWSTPEMYICGRQLPGCVQTTPEKESMDWDKALGRTLTERDIRISARRNEEVKNGR